MASKTHLLDTSVYCQPIRRRPVEAVVRRWQKLGDGALAISVICEAEILQGLRAQDQDPLWRAYDELLKGRFPLLDVDRAVAECYAEMAALLIRRGTPRPSLDLLIAATAKRHGLIVATLNVRDFAALDGVAVEDWSV